MGADTLVGSDVANRGLQDLGEIKEIMLDMRTGRVSYAVPRDAPKFDTANKRFVLDVIKERLGFAPGFDKSHWPDMTDATWEQGIHANYGTKPHAVDQRV